MCRATSRAGVRCVRIRWWPDTRAAAAGTMPRTSFAARVSERGTTMWTMTMMNRLARKGLLLGLFGLPALSLAQRAEVKLWPGAAPGSEPWTRKEVGYKNPQGGAMGRNVVEPGMTVYLPAPENATGASVIVAPGGGFR